MTPSKEKWKKRSFRQTGQRDTYSTDSFIIVTNGKTEMYYLKGLKRSLPDDRKNKVIPKFVKNPRDFAERLQILTNTSPLRGVLHKWIFFDCDDQGQSFDEIIRDAENKKISVAWSNPCLEVWFWAYFDENIPVVGDSQMYIHQFKDVFSRETKIEYEKNDKDIYDHLYISGDEKRAFEWARKKRDEFQKELPYSQWIPSTTCDKLVKEIRGLTERDGRGKR